MQKNYLIEAISIAGGQAALARAIRLKIPTSKISQGHIWAWLSAVRKGRLRPPAEYCAAIEAATGIPKNMLRPDIFTAVGAPHGKY